MFFTFLVRKNSLSDTHTPLRLLIGRIIFLTFEKTSFTILIGRIIFFTCESHSSLLWLARTHLRIKIYNTTFWWVFLSMYIIKKIIKFSLKLFLWRSQLNEVTQDLSLICICKHKTFRRFYRYIQVKKTKLYLSKLPNQTSSPSSCILGIAWLISYEISSFVTAAQTRKTFCSQLTRVWRRSLGGTGGESVNSARIFTDWVANQSARKTLSTVLVYTKQKWSLQHSFQDTTSWDASVNG